MTTMTKRVVLLSTALCLLAGCCFGSSCGGSSSNGRSVLLAQHQHPFGIRPPLATLSPFFSGDQQRRTNKLRSYGHEAATTLLRGGGEKEGEKPVIIPFDYMKQ